MAEMQSNSNKINDLFVNFTNKEKDIEELMGKLQVEEINKRKLEEQANNLFYRVQQKENIVISCKGTVSNLVEQKKALEVQLNAENNEQHSTYLELVKAEESASQLEQEIKHLKIKHNKDIKMLGNNQFLKHETLANQLLKVLGKDEK